APNHQRGDRIEPAVERHQEVRKQQHEGYSDDQGPEHAGEGPGAAGLLSLPSRPLLLGRGRHYKRKRWLHPQSSDPCPIPGTADRPPGQSEQVLDCRNWLPIGGLGQGVRARSTVQPGMSQTCHAGVIEGGRGGLIGRSARQQRPRAMEALVKLAKTLVVACALGVCAPWNALAVDISGAGATFPYPIYAKWADAYKKETGVSLNYQSIGSGGGI